VVGRDPGEHGDVGVDDVRAVVATEQPDLEDCHVDRDIGEVGERRGGEDLEVRGRTVDERFDRGHRGERGRQFVVGDRREVDRDALVDALEVRAGVGADLEPAGGEEGGAMRATDPLPLVPVRWIAG
jgi:hypothetical protein